MGSLAITKAHFWHLLLLLENKIIVIEAKYRCCLRKHVTMMTDNYVMVMMSHQHNIISNLLVLYWSVDLVI